MSEHDLIMQKLDRIENLLHKLVDDNNQPYTPDTNLYTIPGLSVRARTVLGAAGVTTKKDLLSCDVNGLIRYRGCGKSTLDEIRSFIEKLQK